MILLEGKDLSLSEAQKIALMEDVGIKDFNPKDNNRPFIIKLRYTDDMKVKNKKNPNFIEKPARIMVPAKEQNITIYGLAGGKASAQAQYSEAIYYTHYKANPDIPGDKIYEPKYLEMQDGTVVYDNQSERREDMMQQLWFLVRASRQCVDSPNYNTNSVTKFRVENSKKDAAEKSSTKKNALKIQKALYGEPEEGGLTHASLINVAKSMFITGVDAKDDDELRVEIEGKLAHKDNLASFLNYLNDNGDKMSRIRMVVMSAVEGRVIGFDSKTATFRLLEENGALGQKICIVQNLMDENKRLTELCDHYQIHYDEFQLLNEKMAEAIED